MFKPAFTGHIQNCYFCHNAWGKCTCSFPETSVDDPNAPGFEHDHFFITSPNIDETGRFFVNPVQYYGESYTNMAHLFMSSSTFRR